VGGGENNCATGGCSFVGAGQFGFLNTTHSAIVAGQYNCMAASSNYSFIGAGFGNLIFCSPCSSIIGGTSNYIFGSGLSGTPNVHIIGSQIQLTGAPSPVANYTYVNNLCNFGGGVSDCRVKNNICDTGFGLSEILQLRPVHYCFNGDLTKKFGFIAQEIQEVLPDIVKYNPIEKVGADGKRTVTGEGELLLEFDKEAIFASYVNAFKDLYNLNQELQAKIETIEAILKKNNLM